MLLVTELSVHSQKIDFKNCNSDLSYIYKSNNYTAAKTYMAWSWKPDLGCLGNEEMAYTDVMTDADDNEKLGL